MSRAERTEAGLSCGQVLERLSDYVDGSLLETERTAIDAHLRACEVCERFGGRFKRTVSGLRQALGARPAVDPAVFGKLMERWRDGG